jgi:hypothetical protein
MPGVCQTPVVKQPPKLCEFSGFAGQSAGF